MEKDSSWQHQAEQELLEINKSGNTTIDDSMIENKTVIELPKVVNKHCCGKIRLNPGVSFYTLVTFYSISFT